MSKKTEQNSGSAYALPSQQDDLVSTVCKIVEDAPQPMRGMKKTNRVPNAAEQFSSDHHGEYEARGRQSFDKIGRVHRHNQACPKMYDELEKKASASRVVAVTMSRRDALHLTSPYRTKTQRREKKTSKRNDRYKRTRNEKPRIIRNRLTKRKQPNRRIMTTNRSYRLSKIWKSKGCQCHATRHSEFKNSDENNDDVIIWRRSSFKNKSRTSQHSRSYVSERRAGTSVEPSVSSYHSFSSMEHEPMVS